MEKYHGNTVEYWKHNAEENYLTTPISVLKYITVLEKQAEQLRKHAVMSSILNDLEYEKKNYEEPSSYMDDEYYVRCKAKAEAFEEAINIVKKYYS